MKTLKQVKDTLVKEIENDDVEQKVVITTYALDSQKENIKVTYNKQQGVFTDEGFTLHYLAQKFDIDSEAANIIDRIVTFYGAKISNNQIIVIANEPSLNFHNEVTTVVSAIIALNTLEMLEE